MDWPNWDLTPLQTIDVRWWSVPTGTSTWAPSQYPKRRLIVRSREFSKPRDWYFKLAYRFEIWQAHRQQCCRSACQISERSENSKFISRGFETSRDLTIRRLFGYWDGALNPIERLWDDIRRQLNTLRPRKNGRHFADISFKMQFSEWKLLTLRDTDLEINLFSYKSHLDYTFYTRSSDQNLVTRSKHK